MLTLPITAYLAGPVSNCNLKQRAEWRKVVKSGLKKLGYKFIDPAEHVDNWTPLMELVEIERCDLVIANIWRESIGTVVGIVQARRLGKPVILIDPNTLIARFSGKLSVLHSLSTVWRRRSTNLKMR